FNHAFTLYKSLMLLLLTQCLAKYKTADIVGLIKIMLTLISCVLIYDSERSNECIDFTMIISSRNNASISNFKGGFRWKSEYPWCTIGVKSKHFPTVFKKIEKNKQKK
ncbi:Uncharacterized protein FWK35_00023227, partial [Aphis craccivora]